jgi:hypothetical protein
LGYATCSPVDGSHRSQAIPNSTPSKQQAAPLRENEYFPILALSGATLYLFDKKWKQMPIYQQRFAVPVFVLAIMGAALLLTSEAFAEPIEFVGTVTEVTGSRIVLTTACDRISIDLGQSASASLGAKVGDRLEIEVEGKHAKWMPYSEQSASSGGGASDAVSASKSSHGIAEQKNCRPKGS